MTPSPLTDTLFVSVFVFAGGLAVWTLVGSLVPNWGRIIAALFPVSNAASADPHPAGSTLDTAEAGVTPTVEVW